MLSYLDRINVSNARLAGMQKDLHMNDVQWSAGISLFYGKSASKATLVCVICSDLTT